LQRLTSRSTSPSFALILPVLALTLSLSACGGGGGGSSTSPTDTTPLGIEDLVVGAGATAATGDTVTVNYVGTFTNGQKFDSSYDAGKPFSFRVGAGQVIKGWDQGLPGMKVGGKRRLTVPPSLGYGSQAYGPIPANSTLIFEIELLSIAGK
jgi:FKBP-type peptidyl-prolyl cis-trans isomerase